MLRARIGPRLILSLTLALLMLGIGRPAQAATLTVTSTADSGLGSLRQAIALATSGDTIDFALGVCPCTITLTSGELVIDKNLTITGPGAQVLTVSGNSATRVFRIALGVVVQISDLLVSGGNAVAGGDVGGGIRVDGATVTLRNAIISGNSAFSGGGIYLEGALTVIESFFIANQAVSNGGAIYNHGALTVSNSTFRNNESTHHGGGIVSDGTLIVSKSDFLANSAHDGVAGAIAVLGSAHITGGTFSGNSAGGEAGAVYIEHDTQVTIVGSTITDNRAVHNGGGIYSSLGSLAIVNCTITNNSAAGDPGGEGGGGIYTNSGSTLTVVNSTISGNSSALGGGVLTEFATITITNSTIVLNQGGGVVADVGATSVLLSNTIVAGNTDSDVVGGVNTANNNLIGGDVSAIIDTTLADNGGPTQTHALVANSPAIGVGNNAWLPVDQFDLDGDGNTTEPIPFDQRGLGFPRVQGTVDIGAVEAGCLPFTVTPSPLPNGTVGAPYSQQLSAVGGEGPYTFSAASLPPGLTLSSAGVLSGTPTTAGTFTIAVTVTDDRGCARTIELALTVVEDTTCGITVGPATLQTPYVATLYYQPLSASPSGQYTYSVSSGALPPGLYVFSVGHNGFIGGFPTMPGTYTFTIKAKKKNSPCESTRTYTVTVPVTVAPQLTCVVKTGNKQYTARFGYDNTTGAAVTIPVGADNYFTPGTQNRGQVTVFQPGKVTNAFSVMFTVSGKNSDLAIWFVKGPDGVKRPVNITTATFPCQ